jgi:hypothetical protein
MNLRKLFGMPSEAQEKRIKQDMELILERCAKIADKENQDQLESRKSRDGRCPHCKEQNDIVDKIAHVQGKGNTSGNLFGVSGHVLVDTEAVNHCNKCGNEWKKFKIKSITRTDILRVAFNYYGKLLNDPEQTKFSWKVETVKVFDDCCAEAIDNLRFVNRYTLHSEANDLLKLWSLRKLHKSVYDEENKEKLEKI